MAKLIVLDRKELENGIKKEMSEHGMDEKKARQTAIDHLKENPHYYSIADSVGLEDEEQESLEEYKTGWAKNPKGGSTKKAINGIPTGKNFPFTQKSGRLWKIKKAAKSGPVVAVGAGFGGPAEE